MKTISRFLAPLTLLEWGAIMLYFYLSGRIAAFLHPNFRALVLVTGILLVLTAAVLLIWGNEAPCEHECGHDHHEDDHAHGKLTLGGAPAFLVLLLPVALAVNISPDSYGETLINNRGSIENVASLPGVAARMQKYAAATVSPQTPNATADSSEPAQPATNKPRFAGQSFAGQTEPPSPASLDSELPLPTKAPPDTKPMPRYAVDALKRSEKRKMQNAQLIEPVTPQEAGTVGGEYENPALKPNKDGNIPVEVLDLMYVSMEAPMRKDFDGKRVELTGQFLASTSKLDTPGTFKIMRLFMVCCAADVQPVSVKVASAQDFQKYAPMSWLKVVGRVSFPNVGDRPRPLITAESVTPAAAPGEKYLY